MNNIKGIINFSSRDWHGKTNYNSAYTGGRCDKDSWIIREYNQGRLPSLCFLLDGGKVVTRAGRVVATFRYHEAESGNNIWLYEPERKGEYVLFPQISEEEIDALLAPHHGNGCSNPCPDCGRHMEYGSCRWTDCGGAE